MNIHLKKLLEEEYLCPRHHSHGLRHDASVRQQAPGITTKFLLSHPSFGYQAKRPDRRVAAAVCLTSLFRIFWVLELELKTSTSCVAKKIRISILEASINQAQKIYQKT